MRLVNQLRSSETYTRLEKKNTFFRNQQIIARCQPCWDGNSDMPYDPIWCANRTFRTFQSRIRECKWSCMKHGAGHVQLKTSDRSLALYETRSVFHANPLTTSILTHFKNVWNSSMAIIRGFSNFVPKIQKSYLKSYFLVIFKIKFFSKHEVLLAPKLFVWILDYLKGT